MKRLLALFGASLFALGIASASSINCTVSGLGSGGAVDTSTVIVCGSLVFEDFDVVSAIGIGNKGVIDLIGTPSYDSVTGEAFLTFNPSLTGTMDDKFTFEVVGGVSQIDLGVGGSDASVFEEACANPVPTSGPLSGQCITSAGDLEPPLGGSGITVSSGEPDQPIWGTPFGSTSPIYIFKNIDSSGGFLSQFSQSFNPGTSTPEPLSMILLGSGLLGLGLLRRKSRKK